MDDRALLFEAIAKESSSAMSNALVGSGTPPDHTTSAANGVMSSLLQNLLSGGCAESAKRLSFVTAPLSISATASASCASGSTFGLFIVKQYSLRSSVCIHALRFPPLDRMYSQMRHVHCKVE